MDEQNTQALVPQATEEDKEVAKVDQKEQQKYIITPKFQAWERYFLDRSNKETFGNATQSAIAAYNLDPIGQYNTAAQIGYTNMKKHKTIARKYYEKQSITHGKLLDAMWNTALARKDFESLLYFANVMGLALPEYKPVTKPQYVINQQNNNVAVAGDMSLSFVKEEEETQAIEGEIADDETHS